MRAAQDGDAAAYRRVLREVLPVVRLLARRQGVAPSAVEDVAQDVLLTIHRVRHTYDPARPFLPWLAAITRRRAIDARRRTGRIDAHEHRAAETLETFADSGANEAIERDDRRDWLRHAMEALPPKQREALELVKLRDLSVAEAASISGQSPGAVKVNIHRALRALQALWAGG
jgi:RNA polymerase sigma-70 factor (ECF subfamily)